jgi:hypothetical protein
VLGVLLGACGSSAATTTTPVGPPPKPPDCGPAHARTVANSAQARVYTVGGSAYGCALPAGRRFRLGSTLGFPQSRTHLGLVSVAGRIVAYAVTAFGVDTSGTNVLVRRLTDGALLGSYPATTEPFAESFSSVGSIAVKSDGAVAWIGRVSAIGRNQPAIQVFEAPVSARQGKQLDSGGGIALGSLRLQGSTLSWRHGSATRHATLK